MKYLARKVGQLRQARTPGGTVTQTDKQPYVVCYLTGLIFKGMQWGDVNNMKIMSRYSCTSALPPKYLGRVLS